MDLIWVEIQGYKRFEEPAKMNLQGRLVALTGPNEAGKSSFLLALQHLNTSEAFVNTGGVREITRGLSLPPNQVVVKAGFRLSDDDQHAVSGVPGGEKTQWFDVMKYVNGELRYCIRPALKRDLTPRKAAIQSLRRLLADPALRRFTAEGTAELTENIKDLTASLDVEEETLTNDTLEKVNRLANLIQPQNVADYGGIIGSVEQRLRDLLEHERAHPPQKAAIEILSQRRPRFLFFSDEDRSLRDVYDLNALPFPSALANLARLAELDLQELHQAVNEQDQGKIETLEQRANDHLRQRFEVLWSQSGVSVRIRVNGTVLHIFVGSTESAYNSIAERSDGLRHFVALVAFVTPSSPASQKPILLIDEAESHLHYNAQADLVQMLAKQDIASKVIYTTHSAGCLPEDLGTGVRLIRPKQNRPDDRSEVQNWFWNAESVGFSPLLFGMGASTLAFIPVRRGLFAEAQRTSSFCPPYSGKRQASRRSVFKSSQAYRPSLPNKCLSYSPRRHAWRFLLMETRAAEPSRQSLNREVCHRKRYLRWLATNIRTSS
jgi:predicted ATP-dependent endonuclease of OLD family